jgi:hypothetical protein
MILKFLQFHLALKRHRVSNEVKIVFIEVAYLLTRRSNYLGCCHFPFLWNGPIVDFCAGVDAFHLDIRKIS